MKTKEKNIGLGQPAVKKFTKKELELSEILTKASLLGEKLFKAGKLKPL